MTVNIRATTSVRRSLLRRSGVSLLALAVAQSAFAQDATGDDEVLVTGTRQIIQDSIALKRTSTQIVDGLSADEIGDLPALSIGEALENITGVASHRENGGATEVSIRGLGPYLSSTVVNGRAATNGSGDRSVNFSQFPSELVNKLAVFKTQDASQIEGGVAGQIQLDTLKPLDFNKVRTQFEIKGNINPDQLDQSDTEAGDIGYRLTGSHTNQFELGNGGRIGISIGAQISDISQPEAESRSTGPTSNSRPACLITNGRARFTDQTNGGTFTGFSNNPETRDRGDDDCDDFNDRRNSENEDTRGSDTEGVDTSIVNGQALDAGVPFVFAPSQRAFRQNDTRDQRDAIFGAVQFQPTDRWDINLDVQYSERTRTEQRNDLVFNGFRRNDTSLNVPGEDTTTLDSLVFTPSGAVLRQITQNTIEVGGADFRQVEEYLGGGLNVEYELTDRLIVSGDLAYSRTRRDESATEFRIQSNTQPVIEYDRRGDRNVPLYTLSGSTFDVNDPENYVDRLRVRIDQDVQRENEIISGRFDTEYDLGGNFLTTLRAGVRLADQTYFDFGSAIDSGDAFSNITNRFSFEIEDNTDLNVNNQQVVDGGGSAETGLASSYVDLIAATNEACRTEFPEGNDFLSRQRDGDLITNVAEDGSIISATNSFATFDARCVAETTVDGLNSVLDQINLAIADRGDVNGPLGAFSADVPGSELTSRTSDVSEKTTAFYVMSDYETEFDGLPISGNFGARIVQTDVSVTGFRPQFEVDQNDEGIFTARQVGLLEVQEDFDYTEILPSATAIVELAEDKLLRFGVFKAISRADIADLSLARDLSFNGVGEDGEDDEVDEIQDLLNNVTAQGNPSIEALTSWNYDVGFEWYPNADSLFALGAYYKSFQGDFINTRRNESFDFDGVPVERTVTVSEVNENSSGIFGVELTAAHGFTYLPGLLSGLGAKLSYNYADSDFEFEDSRYGDQFLVGLDGEITQTNEGIIAPGGLAGLSEHTISAQVYWGVGPFDAQVNYKYRDDYFQPFISDGTRLRFVDSVGVWEARASYKINKNFRLSAEAINLFGAPKNQFAFVPDDLYEVNDYGPRIFFGLRGRF